MSNSQQTRGTQALRRFKPYLAYKDSGVEWLGEIPEHWEVKPLKHLTAFTTGWTPPTGREDLYSGNHLWANIGDLGPKVLYTTEKTISDAAIREARMRIVKAGSLLFSFKLSVGTVSIAGVDMYTNEAIAAFAPSERIDTRYLYWAAPVFVPRNAQENIYGAPLLNSDRIANAQLLSPSIPEQQAIAAFLDRETAKINALVAKKERLIELLQEKRTALITRAVTKGLDPNVPMKDSGVEWIGEIPEHWERKRLKFLVNYVTSGSRGWAEFYADDGPIFLRIGNVSGEGIDLRLEDVQRVDPPRGAEGERTRTLPGDLLVSITANIGAVAVVSSGLGEAYVNQHLALTHPLDGELFSRWGAYFLSSSSGQPQFKILIQGGTKEGLGLDDVKNLDLLVPPFKEQRRITEFLDLHSERIQTLITKIREGTEHLKEYRAALISAAVTGKIDVRGEM